MAKGGGGGRSAGKRSVGGAVKAVGRTYMTNERAFAADRAITKAGIGKVVGTVSRSFKANAVGERAAAKYLKGLTIRQRLNPASGYRAQVIRREATRKALRRSR